MGSRIAAVAFDEREERTCRRSVERVGIARVEQGGGDVAEAVAQAFDLPFRAPGDVL